MKFALSEPLKKIAVAISAVAFSLIAVPAAQAQEAARLTAIQGDAPAEAAPPAVSTLEVYTGPTLSLPKTAESGVVTERSAPALAAPVTAGYTIMAPTFIGSQSNSYIRFPNGGAGTATYNVTLIGSPTAHNYGTVTVSVAHFASPQYSILDFLKVLGLTSFIQGDTTMSLYVQSPQGGNYVGIQHVTWNSNTGFFENASVCTFKSGVDYSGLNQAVFNVHTSSIQGFPGTIFLHNYAVSEVTFRGNVYDAANGNYLGAFSMTVPANVTMSIDILSIQTTIGFTPGPTQYHLNIQFQIPAGGPWNALASVAVNDQQLQAYTNMSLVCSVNP